MIHNLLIITLICVYIIDLTDFFDTIMSHLWNYLFKGNKEYKGGFEWEKASIFFKPLFCSLCASFWLQVIYLLATANFSIINLGLVCLFSFLTPAFKDLLLNIRDLVTFVFNGFKNR